MHISQGEYELMPLNKDFMLIKHFGLGDISYSGRTILPVPIINPNATTPKIFYFEVQILKKINYESIYFGFCDEEFPLKGKLLGKEKNSIGIEYKQEMWIDGKKINFGNGYGYFLKGDVVGVGIIHWPNSKIECFATSNGELLGKAELPAKFSVNSFLPSVLIRDALANQSARLAWTNGASRNSRMRCNWKQK